MVCLEHSVLNRRSPSNSCPRSSGNTKEEEAEKVKSQRGLRIPRKQVSLNQHKQWSNEFKKTEVARTRTAQVCVGSLCLNYGFRFSVFVCRGVRMWLLCLLLGLFVCLVQLRWDGFCFNVFCYLFRKWMMNESLVTRVKVNNCPVTPPGWGRASCNRATLGTSAAPGQASCSGELTDI